MKTTYLILTAVFLFPSAMTAKEPAPKKKAPATTVQAKAADISANFEAAKAAFDKKDKKTAVANINAAKALVDKEAKAASAENRKPLTDASRMLGALAERVSSGAVKDTKSLDAAFAATHHSLAAYYQKKAKSSLAAGNKTIAGKALGAAANHLETAGKWAGHKFTEGGKQTISLLRKTSGALVKGTGSVVEGTGDVLSKAVGLLNRLGTKITGADPDKKTLVEKAIEGTVKKAGTGVKGAGEKIKGESKPKAGETSEKK